MDAERDLVLFEQAEAVVHEPGVMAELHRGGDAGRERFEKGPESVEVGLEVRWQLVERDPEPRAEAIYRVQPPVERRRGHLQSLPVRNNLVSLEREAEVLGRVSLPRLDHVLFWCPIE